MLKIIKKIIEYIKKLIFWLLGKTEKKKIQEKERNTQKEWVEKKLQKDTKETKDEEENTSSSTAHDLKKEHFFIKQNFFLTDKELEEQLDAFIEKTFKIKINTLPEDSQKEYSIVKEKIIKKIKTDIEANKIEDTKTLEIAFKKHLKKELDKQKPISEERIEISKVTQEVTEKEVNNPTSDYIKKEEEIKNRTVTHLFPSNEKFTTSYEKSHQYENPLSIEPTKVIKEFQNGEPKNKNILLSPYNSKTIPETLTSPVLTNNLTTNNSHKNEETPTIEITENREENIEQESEKREAKTQSETTKTDFIKEKTKEREKEETSKKEQIKEENINTTPLEIENEKIIETAKKEWEKEELIDKNYEEVEKLLDEKIKEIEKLLNRSLNKITKQKLTRELKKLKDTKERLLLFQENDIENLRVALEENIPLEDIVLVTEKLQQITNDQEIKRKELLYKELENKTQKEIQEIERVLVKESYKNALRRLETSLFLSFPFIKNKFFRNFISGLFLFRTFGFVKKIVLGFPDSYEPMDLSYIQKGSEALKESISLTEKNKKIFEETKQITLIKYPELLEDEDFMKDINNLEEKLKKHYEKLMKQDALVNKYFDKSKNLTRKRKLNL